MRYPTIFVGGFPKTKGSWIPFMTKHGIKLRPASNKMTAWANEVKQTLHDKWKWGIIEGAVSVELSFSLPKPKTVARVFPTSKYDGDLDKLVRCIYDCLTGIVIKDDSQIIDGAEHKRYELPCGVYITVSEVM